MLVFIIKRLANALLVMLAVAMLAFLIFRLAGDPVEMMASEQMSQADRDSLRERLGLNDGVFTQYGRFVMNVLIGTGRMY
jgi:peptide/nickel transport system permease protein